MDRTEIALNDSRPRNASAASLLHSLDAIIDWMRLRGGTLRNGILGLMVCVCATLIGTEVWQLWQVHTVVATLVAQVEAEGTGTEALTRFYRLMSSLAVALPRPDGP